MTDQEIYKLIKELRKKKSQLLPNHDFFMKAVIAQHLDDHKEDFKDSFFTDMDDVLEALLKSNNY